MNQDALLDQIYRAIADPTHWPQTLTSVSDYTNSIGGLLVYNAPPGERNLIVLGRLDPQYNAVFHKYHVWNPWTLALMRQPFDRAIVSGSLIERRIIQKTAFYADVLGPQKIHDMICIKHRALSFNGGIGGISFALSARGIDRAENNRRKLQSLTPHLYRALDASLRLAPLADGTRQLARVLQLMPNAALLLNAKAQIVYANPAAETLLANSDGIVCVSEDGLQLSAALPNERSTLSRALAKTLKVADGSGDELGEPLRLMRLSGDAPLLLIPVPLPPSTFPFWELSGIARVLVLIVDPGNRDIATNSLLQITFGLTTAETRVAVLVGGGLSGPQAAHALGISPETVKTHLARCFEKTGTRSQVELARLLSSLPLHRS